MMPMMPMMPGGSRITGMMYVGHVSWVGLVVYRPSTTSHNGGLGSTVDYLDHDLSDLPDVSDLSDLPDLSDISDLSVRRVEMVCTTTTTTATTEAVTIAYLLSYTLHHGSISNVTAVAAAKLRSCQQAQPIKKNTILKLILLPRQLYQ